MTQRWHVDHHCIFAAFPKPHWDVHPFGLLEPFLSDASVCASVAMFLSWTSPHTSSSYLMASKHLNAFQYLELCWFTIQCPILDSKEGLQLPCSGQHGDTIFLISGSCFKTLMKTWLSESSAIVRSVGGWRVSGCVGKYCRYHRHSCYDNDWHVVQTRQKHVF